MQESLGHDGILFGLKEWLGFQQKQKLGVKGVGKIVKEARKEENVPE